MNNLICLNELKNLVRERLLWLMVAVTVCFTALACYNGYQWAALQSEVISNAGQEQQQAISHAQQTLAAREALTSPVNWWDDIHDLRGQAFYLMVNYATKPPLPTALTAIGQSDVQPYFFRMLVSEKQAFINQYDYVHPLGLLIGKFDLAFFAIYILPLLLISSGFNALAQEKQSGQLQLLMLQGLSPLRLLFNQLCIRSCVILVPFFAVSLAALMFFSEGITALSLTVFIALVLGYAAFWLALSALVISLGNTSAYNAAVLTIAWLGFVIIFPSVLNTAIVTANTAPSRIEYVDTLRDKSDDADKASSQVLAQFFQDHPELAKNNDPVKPVDYASKKIAKITAIETAMQPYDDAFQAVLMAQQNRVEQFKFISPATLLQQALFDLSGNGLKRHQDFIEQVLQHHQALRTFFQRRIVSAHQQGDFTPCSGCNADITLPDLTPIPEFHYREQAVVPPWSSLLSLWALAGLFIFLAVFRLTKMNRGQINGALV
ncbi:DUF3526 domain-containing protein [Thalassomonas sp. RHCl1]|uniref:DUF3526 domain-containing protein n=1 Tax=Thalassomonas sp. RHCl1 TaxID=2995320 RepID=UPI00248B6F66|nr:DUF3526 domain-containing protein [Thalassomonas sp. RHCl1]